MHDEVMYRHFPFHRSVFWIFVVAMTIFHNRNISQRWDIFLLWKMVIATTKIQKTLLWKGKCRYMTSSCMPAGGLKCLRLQINSCTKTTSYFFSAGNARWVRWPDIDSETISSCPAVPISRPKKLNIFFFWKFLLKTSEDSKFAFISDLLHFTTKSQGPDFFQLCSQIQLSAWSHRDRLNQITPARSMPENQAKTEITKLWNQLWSWMFNFRLLLLALVCWFLPLPIHTWLWLMILTILAHWVKSG